MSVTKRFIMWLAAGVIVLTAVMALNISLTVFFIYNAICFALLLFDFIHAPKSNVLRIRRAAEDTLYYKTDNTITIFIRNAYTKPLHIEITDDLPDWHFTLKSKNLVHTIMPNEELAFSYDVLPSKRGNFMFTNIHARIRGMLGLSLKYSIHPHPLEMKVYPNLRDLNKYRLILHKNRLLQAGEKRIRLQGAGTEFESLREYVEGDDFRKINWMNSARENKLIINQYEAEKNQPVFMLIDTGRPMSYSVKGYKKLDYAVNAALILSDIINQQGDNSGLIVFDTDIQSVVMPGKGENHRNTLMETLYHVRDTKHTSDYEGVFYELIHKQKRRSLVFIFTDFETLEEAKMLIANIGIIIKRHIPIIVLMKNDSVLKLANGRDQTIRDIYTKAMALEFLRERKNIIRALRARGVFCVESEAEQFALTSINYYLNVKNRNVI